MSGPKYVKDFTFPKDFGFTGSAGQVHVRPHTRQRYAHGGRVSKPPPMPPPETRQIKPTPLPPPRPSPKPPKRIGKAKGGRVGRRPPLKPSPEQVVGGTIAVGAAAAAYDKLRKREEHPVQPPPDERRRSSVMDGVRGTNRRQREQDLGLKKGGKVRRMKDC